MNNPVCAQYLRIEYPALSKENTMKLAVSYALWIPEGVKTIRGIVVHQHGAGTIAAKTSEDGVHDLHWQALAKKWDCAFLVPTYHVLSNETGVANGGAMLWFDPRRGSEKTFLTALKEFAAKSGHPELDRIPWVLWGHSGGAIWSDVMTMLHPDRVAALWLRSGAASMGTNWTEFPEVSIPAAAYAVPTVCNSGIQEKAGIGASQMQKFIDYRKRNAPIAFISDPLTGHWTGNSRYLAIPFLDAVMKLRLAGPGDINQTLKPIVMEKSWLAPVNGGDVILNSSFKGDPVSAIWLPSQTVGKLWDEFIKTGGVSDTTPPPAPFDLKIKDLGDKGTEITWSAEADLESGIHHFIIMKDGQELANLPSVNLVRFAVRPMFQAGWTNSYNDAPANPVPEMRFVDFWPKDNVNHIYSVITVNTVGLKSAPAHSR
ncbi:hypothetical protein [Pedobacter miscanthi]|nr:hypothetical protein [Pedobacter miscanthi]